MSTTLLYLSVVAALAMLARPFARNAGYMILAGSTLALFLQYGIATIPEVHQVALLLWLAAAVLLASNWRNAHLRQRSSL